jgi:hypothetical protein
MKELLFYALSGTIIGLIAQLAGASLLVVMLLSLLVPPAILLGIRIYRLMGY